MVQILVGQTAAAMDVQLMMHALILLTQLMEEVVDTAVEVEVAMIFICPHASGATARERVLKSRLRPRTRDQTEMTLPEKSDAGLYKLWRSAVWSLWWLVWSGARCR